MKKLLAAAALGIIGLAGCASTDTETIPSMPNDSVVEMIAATDDCAQLNDIWDASMTAFENLDSKTSAYADVLYVRYNTAWNKMSDIGC